MASRIDGAMLRSVTRLICQPSGPFAHLPFQAWVI
uniref:Uncharacterized protein n=1 Tax=Anguilla anguilla TaxID=7936 RepID=A0A0E9VPS6_ANGAN